LALFAFNIDNVTKLEMTSKMDKLLKDSHPLQKAFNWANNELWTKGRITLDINWGVEPKLLLNPYLTSWQNQDDGILILDPEFDPSSEEN
jgi:hypothetical protein